MHAAWAVVDASMLTLLLVVGDGPRSALAIGFPILVAASGLRMRPWLSWWTASLAACGYLVVVADAAFRRPEHAVHAQDTVAWTAGLLFLGFLSARVAGRLRGLSGLARLT